MWMRTGLVCARCGSHDIIAITSRRVRPPGFPIRCLPYEEYVCRRCGARSVEYEVGKPGADIQCEEQEEMDKEEV